MKLPNDLIKATDYSKAKNREIHEFEYREEKYIHKYVLGGEHELTPQEVIDCLNGLATIDCDLQTAYSYIKGQEDKISDLEAKLGNYIRALDMAVEEIETAQDMLSDCHADDWAYSLNTSADYFLARTSEAKE